MISESEAKSIVMQLGTAMINDDKKTREMVYEGLDEDSLKRVIRWSMRIQLNFFFQLCHVFNLNPAQVWANIALEAYSNDSQESS